MKFRLIKDLVLNNGFEDMIIMSSGSIIEPNENEEYVFEKLGKNYTKSDILSKPDIFEKIEEVELKTSLIDQDEEDIVKRWRIQLDVKTSMRKLKEIEAFIKENVSSML